MKYLKNQNNGFEMANYCKSLLVLFVLLVSVSSAQVQSPEEGDMLDKIVAVVGNEVIMQSEVKTQILMMAQQNPSIDLEDKKLYDMILDELIAQKLLITKAIEDSVVVTDDEVEQRWEYFLQSVIAQYGSEKRVEQVYQMSIGSIKNDYSEQIRKSLLAQKLSQQKFMDVKVTPREVEEFYNSFKDSLPEVPTKIEVSHIVKNVTASNSAKEDALQFAKAIRDSILSGEVTFEDMAKRHSDDPGTREEGGDLGWFDKGKLVPEFEKAAFQLQEGQVSLPVETPFGYHLIQTIEKKSDAINTRHILIKLDESTDDRDATIKFLQNLKAEIVAGKNFADMAKQFSDDKDTRGFGGLIGAISIEDLPPNLSSTINNMKVGEISEPAPYVADPSKQAYHIVLKKSVIDAHKPNLEQDFKELEQRAKIKKQMEMQAKWLEELKKEIYWEKK